MTFVQLKNEVILLNKVFPQILPHILFLLLIKLIYHRLELVRLREHQSLRKLLPLIFIERVNLLESFLIYLQSLNDAPYICN